MALPPFLLRDHPPVRAGLDWLMTHKARMRDLGVTMDDVTAPMRADLSFESLAHTVVSQQLSTKAAATIWNRLQGSCDVTRPQGVRAMPDDALRACGLSFQKIRYLRGLSDKMIAQEFDPSALVHAPDEAVIAALTALDGFGLWSAQMALIFNLGRPDVWPAGDLGVREGLRIYLNRADRPSVAETEDKGRALFSGRCTAAALILWRVKDKK